MTEKSSTEITLRTMTQSDIAAGMRLCNLAGWNQTAADWELFLDSDPEGSFVAMCNGQIAGVAATITYGGLLAWISMVLVDPQFRRMGIASMLMKRAIEHLKNCPSVKLDATAAGREVYVKLGFADEYELHRLTNDALPAVSNSIPADVCQLTEESLARIVEWDRRVFGADRSVLLKALLKNSPETAFYLERQGKILGFCLGRNGTLFHQIGPVIAGSADDARLLIQAAFYGLAGRPVLMDVLDAHPEILAWIESLGFVRRRSFMRMFRTSNSSPGIPSQQFAITGPEFG